MKILITAPNLDESRNVSGISTIVRQIMEYCPDTFSHFIAGREDGERSGPTWALKQAGMPARFISEILRFKPDVVHLNTALTDRSIIRDAALLAAARITRTPVTLAIHGGKYLVEDIASGWLKAVTKRFVSMAKSIIVYSEYEKELIEAKWPGLAIHTLPNAIPQEFISAAGRKNVRPEFVYFGRMHESKGLHELIEACRILTNEGLDMHLSAFGEGPIREMFVREMTEIMGDKFSYGGVISGNEKWRILRQSDIFVLPSRYGEGLPMAMLEAMATGCVVIAGDVASVSSVVVDGENGFLVTPYDANELAGKMRELIQGRLDHESIGARAAATISSKFEIGEYVERLRKIYAETIES